MLHLNSHVTTNNNRSEFATTKNFPNQQMIIEFNDESNTYAYPEEDFCNFMHFPHENYVFPLINTKRNLTCTCTLLWLIQNLNESEKILETKATRPCLRDTNFGAQLLNCDFKQKLKDRDLNKNS